jgi:hypothetical protein
MLRVPTTEGDKMSTVSTLELKPGARKLNKYVVTGEDADKIVEYFEAKKTKWEARCAEIADAQFDDLIPGMAFGAQLPNGYKIYYEMIL